MNEQALDAIAFQWSIQNRISIARELLKVGYLDEEDYIRAILDLNDEMR